MKRRVVWGRAYFQTNPPAVDPPPPISEEDIQRARYERDTAAAEAARVKKENDDLKKQLPSEEQRTRWAELEAQAQHAEEERLKKSGEFEGWRTQINEKHAREMNEERQARENETAKAAGLENELRETLIGREFADAVELFGPTGKTVLLPAVAQSYFARHVAVETVPGLDGRSERRVVVKDQHGTVIVDAKTGKPATFAKAMSEVIDAHPQKAHLLRGSGKVGSGSSGGAYDGEHGIDTNRLKSSDFKDPKVRDAVRQKQNTAGGLQIGPGFDALEKRRRDRG